MKSYISVTDEDRIVHEIDLRGTYSTAVARFVYSHLWQFYRPSRHQQAMTDDRKTGTHRNPKVGIGLPQINPDLLADRMRGIDDAPRAFLSADPDHILPGHAHTRIG